MMVTCMFCSQELVPGVVHECKKEPIAEILAAAHAVMEPVQLDLFTYEAAQQ